MCRAWSSHLWDVSQLALAPLERLALVITSDPGCEGKSYVRMCTYYFTCCLYVFTYYYTCCSMHCMRDPSRFLRYPYGPSGLLLVWTTLLSIRRCTTGTSQVQDRGQSARVVGTRVTLDVIPRNKKSRPDFFYYYMGVFLRVYTRTYPSTDDTTFVHAFRVPNDIVSRFRELRWNHDRASNIIYDHHKSELSRVVYIGRVAVAYPYVHVCTLFSSTRLSRLKPQC